MKQKDLILLVNPSQTELAYLAGYFDGEGSVHFRSRKQIKDAVCGSLLEVRVRTGDKEVIERWGAAFGGNVSLCKKLPANAKRQQYNWSASGKRGQEVLRLLLPFLVAKRHVAELALQPTFGSQGARILDEEWNIRDSVAAQIYSHNHRVTLVQ